MGDSIIGRRWFAGAVVAVLAGVLAILVVAQPKPAALASTVRLSEGGVTAFGSLSLSDPGGGFSYDGVARVCTGSGAYADIRPGAELTISAGGAIGSIGKLNGGVTSAKGVCKLPWAAVHVPTGLGRYTIAMAGHGSVEVRAEALPFEIPLELGPPNGRLDVPAPYRPVAPADLPPSLGGMTGEGTEVILYLVETPIATASLTTGWTSEPGVCAFLIILDNPREVAELGTLDDLPVITVGVGGHPAQLFFAPSFPMALVMDESGRLSGCTTAC